jgi:cysteine desulfurase
LRAYLDNAATTPIHPAARAAVDKWLDAGNASSLHEEGRAAKLAIDAAREAVTERLGCDFGELLFCSGGTESSTWAILGAALANQDPAKAQILVSATEHHCVLNCEKALIRLGYQLDRLPVDRTGAVQPSALEECIGPRSLLVSVMHANNELGTINDLPPLVEICRRRGALIHSDGAQAFGKIPARVRDLGVDLYSISGHKVGGPKGVGGLYIRAGVKIAPLIAGGGQEREMRGGTENVAAIAGFAAAVEQTHDWPAVARLRARLRAGVLSLGAVPTVSEEVAQLPGHLHVRFPGVSAESLLIQLDRRGVSAGSGAACSSGSIEPSHVMIACGFDDRAAREGIRLTLGWKTSNEEIELALAQIREAVTSIQGK